MRSLDWPNWFQTHASGRNATRRVRFVDGITLVDRMEWTLGGMWKLVTYEFTWDELSPNDVLAAWSRKQ